MSNDDWLFDPVDLILIGLINETKDIQEAIRLTYLFGYRRGASSYIGAPDSEEDMEIAKLQSWDVIKFVFEKEGASS